MRAIILADGEGKRWGNYGGITKHFALINGVPLIQRTIAQLQNYEVIEDIYITSHNPACDFPGTTRYEPENNIHDIDKIYANQPIWTDDILFIWGDVCYTDAALDTITSAPLDSVPHGDPTKGFTFFGRYGKSHVLNKPYGEIFAAHITDIVLLKHCVKAVRDYFERGIVERCNTWALYRAMVGMPIITVKKKILFNGLCFHCLRGNFVEIDDETDDFDGPNEYEEWVKIHGKHAH